MQKVFAERQRICSRLGDAFGGIFYGLPAAADSAFKGPFRVLRCMIYADQLMRQIPEGR